MFGWIKANGMFMKFVKDTQTLTESTDTSHVNLPFTIFSLLILFEIPRKLIVAVYPCLVVNYDFNYFPYKSGPIQLGISKTS